MTKRDGQIVCICTRLNVFYSLKCNCIKITDRCQSNKADGDSYWKDFLLKIVWIIKYPSNVKYWTSIEIY